MEEDCGKILSLTQFSKWTWWCWWKTYCFTAINELWVSYRNYKGCGSIILMGMIGPEYEFLFADVGMNGRNSNGGNWSQSPLKLAPESGSLNLPDPAPLSGRSKSVPYVCTRDDAFPLPSFMMKRYPQKCLTTEKRVFNYRHQECSISLKMDLVS